MTRDKITVRQLFILYILITLSPAIRLFPAVCARYGKTAGWLAPIAAVFAPLIIVTVFGEIYKRRDFGSFGQALSAAFGKIIGKLLLAVYLLWTLLVFFIYIRYYAERLVSSLFTTTAPDFFIITMLALVFFVIRSKLSSLARFGEIAILVLSVILIIFLVSLLPTFKVGNVLPVTYHDAAPVIRSAYPVFSVLGYITPLFFLGGFLENKANIKKHGYKAAGLIAISSAVMVFVVVGSLGADAAARMPLPFFKVSKLIDIMQSFDRFEAVVSSFWIIADFILIAAFGYIITHITREIFELNETKHLAGPVVVFGYAGSMLIAAGWYELEAISENIYAHAVNIALCLAIPLAALAVGKMRGKL